MPYLITASAGGRWIAGYIGSNRGIRAISPTTRTARWTTGPTAAAPGMLMLAEPLDRTLNAVQQDLSSDNLTPWVVHFSPRGRPLTHRRVIELKEKPALVLLCGRYEGIDERLLQRRVDEEISLGDFVLSGGELPALALMDAIIRQLPGALNDAESAVQDSFSHGLLDCPHYTRPEVWQGMEVPAVLKSGNHAAIAKWRHEESMRLTAALRPDLLEKAPHKPD